MVAATTTVEKRREINFGEGLEPENGDESREGGPYLRYDRRQPDVPPPAAESVTIKIGLKSHVRKGLHAGKLVGNEVSRV
jgi:hypothetical protein